MAIYSTTHEGGYLKPLPIKSSRQKIVKQLLANRKGRKANRYETGYWKFQSHIKVTGTKYPYLIHSVFWYKNGKLDRVWDANLNGYRPKKYIKNAIPEWQLKEFIQKKDAELKALLENIKK